MNTKNQNATVVSRGALDAVGKKVERRNSARRAEKSKQEFWLHIDALGREHRYHCPQDRNRPTLHVIVLDGVEYTTTCDIEQWFGATCEFTPVRPRGEGWAIADASSDKFTVWSRPVGVRS